MAVRVGFVRGYLRNLAAMDMEVGLVGKERESARASDHRIAVVVDSGVVEEEELSNLAAADMRLAVRSWVEESSVDLVLLGCIVVEAGIAGVAAGCSLAVEGSHLGVLLLLLRSNLSSTS